MSQELTRTSLNPKLPRPRPTTWYEDNVAEIAEARAQSLLKYCVMPHRYGRNPDYFTFTYEATSAYFIGGGVTLTLDKNGRLYGGLMGLIGTPGKEPRSLRGWLMTRDAPDQTQLPASFRGILQLLHSPVAFRRGHMGRPRPWLCGGVWSRIPGSGISPSWSFGPLQTDLSWQKSRGLNDCTPLAFHRCSNGHRFLTVLYIGAQFLIHGPEAARGATALDLEIRAIRSPNAAT
jgi:hypothetical protein